MKKSTPNHIWLGVFAIWGLILTGVFSTVLGGIVGPGVLQAIRLQNLLHGKSQQLERIQNEITSLQTESQAIEKNSATEQREIRAVLGYAASDEIIFEFSSSQAI